MTTLQNLKQQGGAMQQKSPQATLMSFFEKNKGQLALALPKHLNPDRMVRLALTAFSQNRQLQTADPRSIFASVVIASQMGLEIGVSGQGYLVPYKGKAQFVPGWQGLVDLVSRSGRATVWTGAVFVGDDFDYALGDSPYIKHRPCGEDDPDAMTHVYAVGRVNGSEWPVIEVWPIRRVWKHRDKNNKVGKGHYSYGNEEMYARKVPLLQVIKYMPKSIELTNALNADHAYENGKGIVLDGDFVRADDDDQDQQDAGHAGQGALAAPEEIDTSTGEILAGHPLPNAGMSAMFGLEDALQHVKRGDLEMARDISRGLVESDQRIVEQTIANQQQPAAGRQRRQRDLE
ncbi:recombinase RecT [Chromobacterium violaceum]|uniref:recombinase RecT n=1 Tax=Chromobacterium violaceum TaxID=536 RepID=UPI00385E661E